MPLENSDQRNRENEALKNRIAELEHEIKYIKENSTMNGEFISIALPDDSYELLLKAAKEKGVHVEESVSKEVMKFIYEIMPYFKAFEVKDDSKLSKERMKLLSYLESRCDLIDLFPLMAKAKISPNEHNQLNERNEKSYQTTIGLLIELMTSPKGIESKQPFSSQAVIISAIVEQSIYGQGKSTLESRFSNANDVLADVKKK